MAKKNAEDDNTEFLKQKDALLRRSRAWIQRLEVAVAEDVAAAKEKRGDIRALKALIDNTIVEDNLSLFPDAEVTEPKSLSSRQQLWRPMDWSRSAKKVIVTIDVAKIKESDYVAFFLAKVHQFELKKPWHAAGETKEKATLACFDFIGRWAEKEGKGQKGDVREDFAHLVEKMDKAAKAIPPTISAPPKDWKPPLTESTSTFFEKPFTDAQLDPNYKWTDQAPPKVTELIQFAPGKLYVMLGGLDHPVDCPVIQREGLFLRAVPEKDWEFKTITKKQDAIDGKFCGLVILSKGKRYILDQESTMVRARCYYVRPVDEAFAGVTYDLNTHANPDKTVDKKLLGRLQEGANVIVPWEAIYDVGAVKYINTGTFADTGDNIYWLLPLEEPGNFPKKYPEFKGNKPTLDKTTWFGLQAQPDGGSRYMIGHPDNAILVDCSHSERKIHSGKAEKPSKGAKFPRIAADTPLLGTQSPPEQGVGDRPDVN